MEKDRDLSLVKRVVVGIIFVPVIAWIFLSGEWPLYIFLVLITVVGQWEMYNMFSYKLRFPHQIVGFSAGYAIVTDAFLTNSIYLFTILSLALMISFTIEIISGKNHKLENVTLSIFATLYPALFVTFLFKIDKFPSFQFGAFSDYVLLFVLIGIWIFDTASIK